MGEDRGVPHIHSDEEDIDCCLCDVEVDETEATSDEELPAAEGGVEAAPEEHVGEHDLDGCDLDFNEDQPTTDEELPITVGGGA